MTLMTLLYTYIDVHELGNAVRASFVDSRDIPYLHTLTPPAPCTYHPFLAVPDAIYDVLNYLPSRSSPS